MAKKHRGHYCKICGEYKSNESFSGKGHAQHICKECMGEIKKKETHNNHTINANWICPTCKRTYKR